MLTLKWWLSNSLNFQKSGCDEGLVAFVKHATLDMLPLAVADPFESPPNHSTTRFQQSCFKIVLSTSKYFQSVKGFKNDDPDNIWHHVEANSTLQTSPDSRPWRSPEIHSALLESPWKFQTSKASAARTLWLCPWPLRWNRLQWSPRLYHTSLPEPGPWTSLGCQVWGRNPKNLLDSTQDLAILPYLILVLPIELPSHLSKYHKTSPCSDS